MRKVPSFLGHELVRWYNQRRISPSTLHCYTAAILTHLALLAFFTSLGHLYVHLGHVDAAIRRGTRWAAACMLLHHGPRCAAGNAPKDHDGHNQRCGCELDGHLLTRACRQPDGGARPPRADENEHSAILAR